MRLPDADTGLVAPDPTLERFGLTLATKPGPSGVQVRYTGIAGNRPHTYVNSIALWDTWNPIIEGPHKIEPLVVVPIGTDNQPDYGHVPYDRFTGTDYLVSYQVGGPLTTMAAVRRISLRLAAPVPPPTALSLSVYELTADSLTVKYETLDGSLPHTFGNWIGCWQGRAGPYFAGKPMGWTAVGSDDTMGLVRLSGLTILASFIYRVIYFMGPDADGVPGSQVGATLTFEAARPSPAQL
jgi:hypothetical protein